LHQFDFDGTILACKRGVRNYYVELYRLPDGMQIFKAGPVEPVFGPVCQDLAPVGHPGLILLF